MIKNIIFDMGNVLLDFNPPLMLAASCRNEEAKRIVAKELFGSEEWIQRDLGNISVEQLYESTSKRVSEEYHDDLRNCIDIWQDFMVPLDGAKECLDRIKNSGYGVYILSNASMDFYNYFTKHFDLNYFDGTVVSADIHMIKPGREIYEYILKKYSLQADECLFIDDREDNCLGAQAVGLHTLQFKGDYAEIDKMINQKNS